MATEYARRSTLESYTTRERMGMDDIASSYFSWLALEDKERWEKYVTYREYYDGEHDAMLTERQKQFLELKATTPEFSANYCPLVVNELNRRLSIRGFSAPGSLGGADGRLWRWWRAGKMDGKSKDVHLPSIRDGDSFLIVGWDNDRQTPAFYPNLAYNGSEGVDVHYNDENNEIEFATKYWLVNDGDAGYRRRVNIYRANRIERYISDDRVEDGRWAPYTGDGQPGVLPWTDRAGKPLGVPVFHFAHNRAGMRWGMSILEPVIPLQNALNKSVIDLIAAADTTGFRIYYATGVTAEDDEGNELKVHPGMLMVSPNVDAKFGFIPGEDLRPLIEVVDAFKISIAQVTETPLHLFQVSGQNASEGAQRQQEVGMISKAEDASIYYGNEWENVMQLCIRMHNTFSGEDKLPEDELIEPLWRDFEVRDRVGRVREQAAALKDITAGGAGVEAAARAALFDEETAKDLARFATVPGGMDQIGPMGTAAQRPEAQEPEAQDNS